MVFGIQAIFIGIPFLILIMLDNSISKKKDIKRGQDNMNQWKLNQSNWKLQLSRNKEESRIIQK